MHINRIENCYNQSQSFQASRLKTLDIKHNIENGQNIIDMYNKNKAVIDEITKDVDLVICSGDAYYKGKTLKRLNIIASDIKRKNYCNTLVFPDLIIPDGLINAIKETIYRLKNQPVGQ